MYICAPFGLDRYRLIRILICEYPIAAEAPFDIIIIISSSSSSSSIMFSIMITSHARSSRGRGHRSPLLRRRLRLPSGPTEAPL